jgi:RNA polymerase sigma-70 factor (ECF subfamily)
MLSSGVTVAPGGVLNIEGAATKVIVGGLTNAGTINWTDSGRLAVVGVVHNLAGGVFDAQGDAVVAGHSFDARFLNAGTFRKSGGTGLTIFSADAGAAFPFDNTGLMEVLTGSVRFDTGGDLVPEAVAADTPHGELEQMELASELEKGIESLPPLYRESFVLRHVEGLGYDEMSSILGVNRDTLKMRVYKARTLLARALAHLGASSR